MSKNKNKQQNAEKETPQSVAQGNYTVTATLIDCTYCEILQEMIEKYEEQCKAAQDLINVQNKLIESQEKAINELRKHIEFSNIVIEYLSKCLDWTAEHLGIFACRKYKKIFSIEAFKKYRLTRTGDDLLLD